MMKDQVRADGEAAQRRLQRDVTVPTWRDSTGHLRLGSGSKFHSQDL